MQQDRPSDLPSLPGDEQGPVFREPWEAQAFSLVLALHQQGLFSWEDWSHQLSGQISRAQEEGDPDLGDTYYRHWLAALEELVTANGLTNLPEIDDRVTQWRSAYLNTPHGQPVKLDNRQNPTIAET